MNTEVTKPRGKKKSAILKIRKEKAGKKARWKLYIKGARRGKRTRV